MIATAIIAVLVLFVVALSALCMIAWMRDAANDWRKDIP